MPPRGFREQVSAVAPQRRLRLSGFDPLGAFRLCSGFFEDWTVVLRPVLRVTEDRLEVVALWRRLERWARAEAELAEVELGFDRVGVRDAVERCRAVVRTLRACEVCTWRLTLSRVREVLLTCAG